MDGPSIFNLQRIELPVPKDWDRAARGDRIAGLPETMLCTLPVTEAKAALGWIASEREGVTSQRIAELEALRRLGDPRLSGRRTTRTCPACLAEFIF